MGSKAADGRRHCDRVSARRDRDRVGYLDVSINPESIRYDWVTCDVEHICKEIDIILLNKYRVLCDVYYTLLIQNIVSAEISGEKIKVYYWGLGFYQKL